MRREGINQLKGSKAETLSVDKSLLRNNKLHIERALIGLDRSKKRN